MNRWEEIASTSSRFSPVDLRIPRLGDGGEFAAFWMQATWKLRITTKSSYSLACLRDEVGPLSGPSMTEFI
jgi:hypothetical protein